MKKLAVLAVVAVFALAAGNVFALPFNERPASNLNMNATPSNEDTLQEVLNAITGDAVDAMFDQSTAAIWQPTDGDVDVYAVTMFTGANSGTFGIYSYTTGVEVDLGFFDNALGGLGPDSDSYKTEFSVSNQGMLIYDNKAYANFGSFGFYWKTNNTTFYTEDDKNNGTARALAYQLEAGVEYDVNAYGAMDPFIQGFSGPFTYTSTGDEWLLAWEDWTDFDFNDAIFAIEDITPVPEPGTLLLLGAGLLGLVGLRKRVK
jgi:hypothetical protein